jgi:biopolymer transport protein ExbD
MKINLDPAKEEARIEIIPLIDVIFCILTFFLLAALQLTRQQSISVDLPQAGTGEPQMRDMLVVSLDEFNQVYIEQKVMGSLEELVKPTAKKQQFEAVLKNYKSTNPNGLMVVYAPRTVIYNDVMRLLDRLRSLGGSRVALATIPNAANSSVEPSTPNLGAPVPQPYQGSNPVVPNTLPNSGRPQPLPGNPQAAPQGNNPAYIPVPQVPNLPNRPAPKAPSKGKK